MSDFDVKKNNCINQSYVNTSIYIDKLIKNIYTYNFIHISLRFLIVRLTSLSLMRML